MKCLFVFNPFARRGLGNKEIELIKKRFQGNDIEFYQTHGQGSITKYVKENGDSFDLIVAVGGDGTIHEMVCGVLSLDKKPIVGVLPRGTMNDVSKELGYSTNINKSIDILLKGNTKLKNAYSINDTFFFYGLAIGRYANVSYETVNKKQFGKLTYYFSCIKNYFTSKPISIKLDNKEVKISQLFILDTKYLAGYKMDKVLDDKLHIKYIEAKNRFIDTIKFAKFLFSHGKKSVKELIVDSITIEGDNISFTLDGEMYLANKALVKPLSEQIRIICK